MIAPAGVFEDSVRDIVEIGFNIRCISNPDEEFLIWNDRCGTHLETGDVFKGWQLGGVCWDLIEYYRRADDGVADAFVALCLQGEVLAVALTRIGHHEDGPRDG